MVIVAVDPNKTDLKRLVTTLRKTYPGSEVILFTDSQPMAKYLENNPVDILFTEIPMYPIDGFALQQAAERVQPAILTIFVTDTDVYAGQAIKTHATGYILKPVSKESILQALEATKFQHP